jgi:2'-5' RNA ligase
VARQLADAFGPGAQRAVSWVTPANMHLTLRFIGEVDPEIANELTHRLAKPFGVPPFRLAVGGLGAFPRSGPPRVIWLGLTAGAGGLSAVHDEVESRLKDLPIEREDRPFRAHLTLGRVRTPLGAAAGQAIASVRADAIGACDIGEVTLFESRLSPRGAVYTALARGPLSPLPGC